MSSVMGDNDERTVRGLVSVAPSGLLPQTTSKCLSPQQEPPQQEPPQLRQWSLQSAARDGALQ